MEDERIRKIKSNDGKLFEIDEKCLELSKVLKGMANDFADVSEELPVNEVDSKNLEKIINYLKHHKDEKPKEIPKPLPSPDLKPLLSQWDYDFITPLTLEECVDLVNSANFLDIEGLVNLTSAKLASEMLNCSIEEAREKFGIKCDMTVEEIKEMDKYPLD